LRQAGCDTQWADSLASGEGIEEALSRYQPDFIGVSLRNIDDVLISKQETFFEDVALLVAKIRQKSDRPVVLGGSGFSIFPERLLELAGADLGICGEGEAGFVSLISALQDRRDATGIPGLVYRHNGGIAINAPERCFLEQEVQEIDRPASITAHYLRASGMLNTAWEDDGETLKGCNWHGYAWGAECAWNASATTPEDFNRRIGAVLFGEREDHFGRAIELLAQTHKLAGMEGMNNARFWRDDFTPRLSPPATRTMAERLLKPVQPAIEQLEACKKEATVNAALLDSFLCGARRMELIGRRMVDGLEASQAYAQAYETPDPKTTGALLAEVEKRVRAVRDAHEALGREFKRLWLSESRPYALDWTMRRYASAATRYDKLSQRLVEARQGLEAGKPLPRPEDLGLAVPTSDARRTRPHKLAAAPLASDAPWAEPAATHRFAALINAGSADRFDLPVELDVTVPEALAGKPVRAFAAAKDAAPREVLAQLNPTEAPGKSRLSLLLPGPLAKNAQAAVHVYLGLPAVPPALPEAVATRDGPDGAKWLENDQVRLLLGREGGHIYRWEVKALGGRSLTMPGGSGWAGFSDLAPLHRNTPHQLNCAARGPALVRYVCTDDTGLVKAVSLWGGVSWMEVALNETVGHYWDFDDPKNFGADGPTPGTYLFSSGATGAVGAQADGVRAQVKAPNTYWGLKFNAEKVALGLVTPETPALHHVAPGAGAGGVGIESSPPAGHFVTFAGLLHAEPAETMNRLQRTLDFKNPPEIEAGAVEARK
ncbi:MAG: cobalamin-dependent protein, partial [Planctomycetota bacterium]